MIEMFEESHCVVVRCRWTDTSVDDRQMIRIIRGKGVDSKWTFQVNKATAHFVPGNTQDFVRIERITNRLHGIKWFASEDTELFQSVELSSSR